VYRVKDTFLEVVCDETDSHPTLRTWTAQDRCDITPASHQPSKELFEDAPGKKSDTVSTEDDVQLLEECIADTDLTDAPSTPSPLLQPSPHGDCMPPFCLGAGVYDMSLEDAQCYSQGPAVMYDPVTGNYMPCCGWSMSYDSGYYWHPCEGDQDGGNLEELLSALAEGPSSGVCKAERKSAASIEATFAMDVALSHQQAMYPEELSVMCNSSRVSALPCEQANYQQAMYSEDFSVICDSSALPCEQASYGALPCDQASCEAALSQQAMYPEDLAVYQDVTFGESRASESQEVDDGGRRTKRNKGRGKGRYEHDGHGACGSEAHDDSSWMMEYTTVMLRNIPNQYQRHMLVSLLNQEFRGHFDFLYLPIDFKNRVNVCYAFINFTSVAAREKFEATFNGVDVRKCMQGVPLKKAPYNMHLHRVVEVKPARVQGLEENIRRLRNSPVMNELVQHPDWMPLLLDADGQEKPFPVMQTAVPVRS